MAENKVDLQGIVNQLKEKVFKEETKKLEETYAAEKIELEKTLNSFEEKRFEEKIPDPERTLTNYLDAGYTIDSESVLKIVKQYITDESFDGHGLVKSLAEKGLVDLKPLKTYFEAGNMLAFCVASFCVNNFCINKKNMQKYSEEFDKILPFAKKYFDAKVDDKQLNLISFNDAGRFIEELINSQHLMDIMWLKPKVLLGSIPETRLLTLAVEKRYKTGLNEVIDYMMAGLVKTPESRMIPQFLETAINNGYDVDVMPIINWCMKNKKYGVLSPILPMFKENNSGGLDAIRLLIQTAVTNNKISDLNKLHDDLLETLKRKNQF